MLTDEKYVHPTRSLLNFERLSGVCCDLQRVARVPGPENAGVTLALYHCVKKRGINLVAPPYRVDVGL